MGDFFLLYKEAENQKHDEEREVEGGEAGDVGACSAGVMRHVFAEGDQACERRDEGAGAADVDAQQQFTVVIGELGEQDGAGDVTDDLAGEGTEDQYAALQEAGEKLTHDVDAGHIAREKEEANEENCREDNVHQLRSRFQSG